jgi:hypothetical protein
LKKEKSMSTRKSSTPTARRLRQQLAALQTRLRAEGRNVGHLVDQAVRGVLVALDVPSRREVTALTSRVDALSRKIDGPRRPAVRRAARRRPAASAARH